MKQLLVISLLLSGGFSAAAGAAPKSMDYKWFQVGYVDATLLDEIDLSGFDVTGSVDIGPNSFVTFNFEKLSGEFFGFDIDTRETSFGFGGAWATNVNTDLLLAVRYIEAEAEVGSDSAKDDAYGIDFGFRTRASAGTEVFGFANHVRNDDVSDTGVTFGVNFDGFVISYESADDYDAIMVALRFGG